MTDVGFGTDTFGVGVRTQLHEAGRAKGLLLVERWDQDQSSWVSRLLGGEPAGKPGFQQPKAADFRTLGVQPYLVTEGYSNLVTTGGWDRILTLAFGGGGTTYASANARIGVGTGTLAAASGQTDLNAAQGAAGRYFAMLDATPTTSAGTAVRRLSFVATFATGVANIAWQEECIDQGTTTGTGATVGAMLNRLVSNQSTKVSGQTWTATFNLDFT
jgi:hypothetical protein